MLSYGAVCSYAAYGGHRAFVLRLVCRSARQLITGLGRSDGHTESSDWYNASYIITWGEPCRLRVRRMPISRASPATRDEEVIS